MKKIIIGICCILCVCSCTNTKDNSDTPLNTEYLEQEITLNLDKIMKTKKRKISIIGSTGSIGTQALEVIEKLQDKFEIIALAGGRNVELLKKQAEKFRPKFICHSAVENSTDSDFKNQWLFGYLADSNLEGTTGASNSLTTTYRLLNIGGNDSQRMFVSAKYNAAVGSGTQPVYIQNNGNVAACSYSLNATIEAGTANRMAYYKAANQIGSSGHYVTSSQVGINSNTTYQIELTYVYDLNDGNGENKVTRVIEVSTLKDTPKVSLNITDVKSTSALLIVRR